MRVVNLAEILGDPLLANAGLDRLLDRSHVVEITGRSYRLARRGQPAEVPQTESLPV